MLWWRNSSHTEEFATALMFFSLLASHQANESTWNFD
jgi:hypothetical protein